MGGNVKVGFRLLYSIALRARVASLFSLAREATRARKRLVLKLNCLRKYTVQITRIALEATNLDEIT